MHGGLYVEIDRGGFPFVHLYFHLGFMLGECVIVHINSASDFFFFLGYIECSDQIIFIYFFVVKNPDRK